MRPNPLLVVEIAQEQSQGMRSATGARPGLTALQELRDAADAVRMLTSDELEVHLDELITAAERLTEAAVTHAWALEEAPFCEDRWGHPAWAPDLGEREKWETAQHGYATMVAKFRGAAKAELRRGRIAMRHQVRRESLPYRCHSDADDSSVDG